MFYEVLLSERDGMMGRRRFGILPDPMTFVSFSEGFRSCHTINIPVLLHPEGMKCL